MLRVDSNDSTKAPRHASQTNHHERGGFVRRAQRPDPKEKKINPKMTEGLEKLIATVEDMNKRLAEHKARYKSQARDLRDWRV